VFGWAVVRTGKMANIPVESYREYAFELGMKLRLPSEADFQADSASVALKNCHNC
jgi:hypothetical protein